MNKSILEMVRSLTPDKQQELLNHAKHLQPENRPPSPFKSIKGLWSDLGVSLSAGEIDEAP